jgi:hypothetical protein
MANSLLHHTKFLAGKAQKKQLITFQEFADEFEIKTIRSTTTPLKKVLKWTESKGLPPLNAIVVTADNANAEYIEKDEDIQKSIESVFEYPWKTIFLNLPDD